MSTKHKETTELQVIHSDRIELARMANQFIGNMIAKELTINDEEKKTYLAALAYLEEQFRKGQSEEQLVRTKYETESSLVEE